MTKTLTMTPEVTERLKRHLNDGDQLILDFDDGVGQFSKVGVCSLDTSFRLLISNEPVDSTYNEVLDSPLGDVHIKGYADNYFDEGATLELSGMGLISLKSPSGLIDPNVEVIDQPQRVLNA